MVIMVFPGTIWWCSFRDLVCSAMVSRHSPASAIPTGNSTNMADTRLLRISCSSSARVETGTSVRTMWSLTVSRRFFNSARNPMAIAASTTSLTVQP